MRRIEDVVELMMLIGHRSRIAFEDACQFEEFVAHEILLLRALVRTGQETKGRELARALGWSPGRITQVVDRLVEKQHVIRMPRLSITGRGASEAEQAIPLLESVAEAILDGIGEEERELLVASLRRIGVNSERLWRIRRSAS